MITEQTFYEFLARQMLKMMLPLPVNPVSEMHIHTCGGKVQSRTRSKKQGLKENLMMQDVLLLSPAQHNAAAAPARSGGAQPQSSSA